MGRKEEITEPVFCHHCGHSDDDHPNRFLCRRPVVTSDDGECRCYGWREKAKVIRNS